MRLPLLLCMTTLAAATALAQQPDSSSKSQSDQSSQSSSSILSPTGKGSGYSSQQQHLRSTKVIGAQVKTSTGEDVGRIEDVVLNPTTGRIDFAVISAEGKLVPVPWQLLSISAGASAQGGTGATTGTTTGTSTDPSATTSTTPGSSGIYASASAGQQPTFTLNVDKSKLQSGPSFDRSRWPEMSASWSQRIYAHFGVQPGSAVGGTGTGSTTTDQGSTGSSTDTSSGKASSDSSDKSSSEDKK